MAHSLQMSYVVVFGDVYHYIENMGILEVHYIPLVREHGYIRSTLILVIDLTACLCE